MDFGFLLGLVPIAQVFASIVAVVFIGGVAVIAIGLISAAVMQAMQAIMWMLERLDNRWR